MLEGLVVPALVEQHEGEQLQQGELLAEFDPSPYPNLRILILTNGLLLTSKTWDSVCNEIIDAVSISIDAATPEVCSGLLRDRKSVV